MFANILVSITSVAGIIQGISLYGINSAIVYMPILDLRIWQAIS